MIGCIYISDYINNFNKNVEILLEKRIKTLWPNEEENIYAKDLIEYEAIKEELRNILVEIEFINENYFFYKLTGYVLTLFERYIHIINMK